MLTCHSDIKRSYLFNLSITLGGPLCASGVSFVVMR